jgi:hypothetical protein
VSAVADWEWRYLRWALVAIAAVLALQVAGWLTYRAVHEGTPPYELTARCLSREKRLDVRPVINDPIAALASRGALAARVEGLGVHVSIAGSESEAERLVDYYESVAGALGGALERRGKVVYLWEGVATSTQRQTMYDCFYD